MPTAPNSTMMDQSYGISIEGLNYVAPKWSDRSSKVGHLVFSLDQWYAIVPYQIPWFLLIKCTGAPVHSLLNVFVLNND